MLRRVKNVGSIFVGCMAASQRQPGRCQTRCYKADNTKSMSVSSSPFFSVGPNGDKNDGEKKTLPLPESFGRLLFTSWQQGVVASIGAVMGIGVIGFFLYAPVKDDTVHHTAVVASEALGDVRLREQATQLSKEVVENVLRDPKTLHLVTQLVVQLLRDDDTMIVVSSFLRALFEDHYTQEVTKKFVLTTILDPWIQEQLRSIAKELAKDVLRDPEVKNVLVAFLTDSAVTAMQDEELHYDAARTLRSVAKCVLKPWS